MPAADIAAALAAKESLAQDVVPRYSVTSYRIEYLTTDADGKEVRASVSVRSRLKESQPCTRIFQSLFGTGLRILWISLLPKSGTTTRVLRPR